jgi:hypothetical protein
MGYTTEFKGLGFWTDRPLSREHTLYINKFAETRHILFDMTRVRPGTTRSNVDVPDTAAFVLEDDILANGASLNYNNPPPGVPGLWCQWTVDEDGHINWDGNEKFYNFEEWLTWLIENLLKPWGYVLNGTLDYQGEDDEDFGRLIVVDNKVTNVFQWKGGE